MFHGTKTGLAMSLAAAVAVLVSAPALAGNPDRSKFDVNRDGKVDFAEAQAARPDFTQDQFNKADANRDGQLSDEEWSTLPGKGITMANWTRTRTEITRWTKSVPRIQT